jgi:hypothetical protein
MMNSIPTLRSIAGVAPLPPLPIDKTDGRIDGATATRASDSKINLPPDGWHANTTTLTRELALPGAPIRLLRLDIETWNPERTTFSLMLDGMLIAAEQVERDARGDDAAEYRATAIGWAMRMVGAYLQAPLIALAEQANRELAAIVIARQSMRESEPLSANEQHKQILADQLKAREVGRATRAGRRTARKATKKGRR